LSHDIDGTLDPDATEENPMTRFKRLSVFFALFTAAAATGRAETPVDSLIGTWRIDAVWSDGTALWAQAEYRPVLGGAFVEGRVFVRDGDGPLYQRYRSFFTGAEEPGAVVAHTFSADGASAESLLQVEGHVITTAWSAGGMTIAERMELESAEVMRWQVWITGADDDRKEIMDGTWRKVDADPIVLPTVGELDAGVAALEPWLGGWETSTVSGDGSPYWSRMELRAGLAGRFVDAEAWVPSRDRQSIRRSIMVVVGPADDDDHPMMVTFAEDGSVSTAAVRSEADGVLTIESMTPSGGQISQAAEMVSTDAFRWRVQVRETPLSAWTEIMDGMWLRQGGNPGDATAPIDPDRFAAAGADLRSFTKERVIPAAVDRVWAAWATDGGWSDVFPPPSASRIDLAIGGRYEWLFDGAIGGNGSQVLSYIPDRMMSFSWNAPPSQPDSRLARTWVVVETEALDGDRTRVRLTHLGFGDGPSWDETMAYFDKAWEYVLAQLENALTTK
jgi:uncharacterized protein YndB with AHSA1/START domain